MYLKMNRPTPSKKSAEYQFLQLWVHNELTRLRHHHNAGWALIKHGSQTFSEQGFKCERPEPRGEVYFLFSPSVPVEEGDVIAWGAGSGQKDEWMVTSINQTIEKIQCEVRRPKPTEQSTDDLLRRASLFQAADYLSNARQRLSEGTPASLSDCVTNCRNTLQTTLRHLTGEGQLSAGIRKLKDSERFGDRESEFVQALEKLLLTSKDLLSKSGAHPPMPGYSFAAFALELTTATLRFLLSPQA